MNRPRLGRSDPRRGPQASFPGQSGQWGPLGRSARRGAPPARPRRKRLVTRFRVVGMRGGQPPRGAPRAAAPSATRGSKVSHAELWPPGVEIEPRGGAGGARGAAFCGALGVAPSASSSGARRAPGPPRARAAPAALPRGRSHTQAIGGGRASPRGAPRRPRRPQLGSRTDSRADSRTGRQIDRRRQGARAAAPRGPPRGAPSSPTVTGWPNCAMRHAGGAQGARRARPPARQAEAGRQAGRQADAAPASHHPARRVPCSASWAWAWRAAPRAAPARPWSPAARLECPPQQGSWQRNDAPRHARRTNESTSRNTVPLDTGLYTLHVYHPGPPRQRTPPI